MNGRRTARLVWVILCNSFLFVSASKVVLPPDDKVLAIIGVIVCGASGIGIALEALKQRLAAAANITTPAFVFVLMASSVLWLPMLAAREPNGSLGEAAEGAGFLLIFSLIPLCLALITGLLYRIIDIETDRSSITLGM